MNRKRRNRHTSTDPMVVIHNDDDDDKAVFVSILPMGRISSKLSLLVILILRFFCHNNNNCTTPLLALSRWSMIADAFSIQYQYHHGTTTITATATMMMSQYRRMNGGRRYCCGNHDRKPHLTLCPPKSGSCCFAHQHRTHEASRRLVRQQLQSTMGTGHTSSTATHSQQQQLVRMSGSSNSATVPNHIAFICDGNTRWAKQHNVPTIMGHFMGSNRTMDLIQSIRRIVPVVTNPTTNTTTTTTNDDDDYHGNNYNNDNSTMAAISHLTFYAFSTENWNRPSTEIAQLFRIIEQTAYYWYNTLVTSSSRSSSSSNTERSIVIKIIGNLDDPRIPNSLRTILNQLQNRTATRQQSTSSSPPPLTICIAINYGGRQDIVRASQRAMMKLLHEKRQQQQGEETEAITEQDIQQYITEETIHANLDTQYSSSNIDTDNNGAQLLLRIPDPDLLIRTSGEQRLSNFLLWNLAYTEIYFTDLYWPDFTMMELQTALVWYSQRQRRFGSTGSK